MLHAQLLPADNPVGQVLLLHGLGEHSGRHVALAFALQGAGFSVYSYDQRGHGRSTGARALVNIEELMRDHFRAREFLRETGRPTFLWGHSLGGLVTALSAARDPRGIQGVVLSSPALAPEHGVSAPLRLAAGVLGRLAPALPVTELDVDGLARNPEVVRAYRADPLVYHGRVRAGTARSMIGAARELRGLATRWRLPTLVVHGDADRLTHVSGSQRFVETIASEDRRLVVRPGGYHELFNDDGHEEMTALALDWLRERTPTAHHAPGPPPTRQ